VLRPDLSQETC